MTTKKFRKRLTNTEVKSLYEMGFAIHWIKPKSKKPVNDKWTTGERDPWSLLQKTFRRGMNVGVRLGKVSRVGDGYLAVIDCDVKDESPSAQEEMDSKLGEILARKGVVALSGRGNGSQHVYVVSKRPLRPQRLAQSPKKVKVHMPSVEPSKRDREVLSENAIKAGYRSRAAWEISIMGEGQQVVLPPSIHPDSGQPYLWKRSPLTHDFIQFNPEQKEKKELGQISSKNFKAVQFDLVSSNLSDEVVDQIVSGKDVSDRSASMLGVANSMIYAGMSDREILSVLTDPDNYLGQVAYEHTQSKDRKRAAQWVEKYTLRKARDEADDLSAFDEEIQVEKLEPENAKKQADALVPEVKNFRDLIERGTIEQGRRPKNTLKNTMLILKGEGGNDVFKRDEFANSDLYGRHVPWENIKVGSEIADIDTIRIKEWLSRKYRFEPSNDRINETIAKIADTNRFHPVRDYLETLEWDGVPRIDTWLRDYLSARAPEPYLSAISRKTLIAMVKRVYEPGCKHDEVLILEGAQGVGKSTALRKLAGDSWFSDAHINVADKDAIMTMKKIWLVELGELSGMRQADAEQLKEFISRSTDRIRVPYGKRAEDFPRQCVFIATTNREEYLKDPTGNRRYWPVKVGRCNFNAIGRDRDQLFAEALVAYRLGEPTYLEDENMKRQASAQQGNRMVQDPWRELIDEWFTKEKPKFFTARMLFEDFGPLSTWKADMREFIRVASVLKTMGFVKKLRWNAELGKPEKVWTKLSED